MPSATDAAMELTARRAAREYLLPFAEYTYKESQDGWVTGDHHRKICAALEKVERKEVDRLAIFTPPRHGKSELASKRFPAWYLGRHPDRQVICSSYGSELAIDFGREVRHIMWSKEYQTLFPGVRIRADSKSAHRFHLDQGGVYYAAGVGGPITGRGAHIAIIDDPVRNRVDADSDRVRDTIWQWYSSTLRTRLMPGGAIVLMCTRWHEDDLAGRALQSGEWEVLSLPAIANEGTDNEQALWPAWYDIDDLRRLRDTEITKRDWNALYQQQPRTESGGYFQRAWFSKRWVKPEGNIPDSCYALPKCKIYMASDFAVSEASEGRDPDWTEHGVFGVGTDGRLYVLDWWSGQTTADVWVEALLDLWEKWKPMAWFGEAGMIRKVVAPFLGRRSRERRVYSRIEWIPSVQSKEARARALQARSAMGNVVFPAATDWAGEVIDQMVGFPGVTHDDKVDVMSLFCMALDQAHPAVQVSSKPTIVDRYRGLVQESDDWRTA